jgi:hypothetical protein
MPPSPERIRHKSETARFCVGRHVSGIRVFSLYIGNQLRAWYAWGYRVIFRLCNLGRAAEIVGTRPFTVRHPEETIQKLPFRSRPIPTPKAARLRPILQAGRTGTWLPAVRSR